MKYLDANEVNKLNSLFSKVGQYLCVEIIKVCLERRPEMIPVIECQLLLELLMGLVTSLHPMRSCGFAFLVHILLIYLKLDSILVIKTSMR